MIGVDDSQALASSAPDGFGGEERVKDALTVTLRRMPVPVSSTEISRPRITEARRVAMVMRPLTLVPLPATASAMAWAALTMRLRITWLNSPATHGTGGKFGSN
jgi:hypothetical protein